MLELSSRRGASPLAGHELRRGVVTSVLQRNAAAIDVSTVQNGTDLALDGAPRSHQVTTHASPAKSSTKASSNEGSMQMFRGIFGPKPTAHDKGKRVAFVDAFDARPQEPSHDPLGADANKLMWEHVQHHIDDFTRRGDGVDPGSDWGISDRDGEATRFFEGPYPGSQRGMSEEGSSDSDVAPGILPNHDSDGWTVARRSKNGRGRKVPQELRRNKRHPDAPLGVKLRHRP